MRYPKLQQCKVSEKLSIERILLNDSEVFRGRFRFNTQLDNFHDSSTISVSMSVIMFPRAFLRPQKYVHAHFDGYGLDNSHSTQLNFQDGRTLFCCDPLFEVTPDTFVMGQSYITRDSVTVVFVFTVPRHSKSSLCLGNSRR